MSVTKEPEDPKIHAKSPENVHKPISLQYMYPAPTSASSTSSSTGILSELHATATGAGIQSILYTTAAAAQLVALSQDKNRTAASRAPLLESSPKPKLLSGQYQVLGHLLQRFCRLVLHVNHCSECSVSSEQKKAPEIYLSHSANKLLLLHAQHSCHAVYQFV